MEPSTSFDNYKVWEVYRRTMDNFPFYEHSNDNELTSEEVLKAHFLLADYFYSEGEGLGGFGPKSNDLLISAIERQNTSFGGVEKWQTIYEKAATVLYGLIMNHPFHDANKRTAYLSVVHYLYKNKLMIKCSESELEDFTVEISERNIKKYSRYKELERKTTDPEIHFIAWWLKANTRHAEKIDVLVTFRELEAILRTYECFFDNINNNQADIMQNEEVTFFERDFFFIKRKVKKVVVKKVCRIGFPGWSRVAGKGIVNHIRKQLNLTPQHGVDSRAFFKGDDDMTTLMRRYRGALERLAYR